MVLWCDVHVSRLQHSHVLVPESLRIFKLIVPRFNKDIYLKN